MNRSCLRRWWWSSSVSCSRSSLSQLWHEHIIVIGLLSISWNASVFIWYLPLQYTWYIPIGFPPPKKKSQQIFGHQKKSPTQPPGCVYNVARPLLERFFGGLSWVKWWSWWDQTWRWEIVGGHGWWIWTSLTSRMCGPIMVWKAGVFFFGILGDFYHKNMLVHPIFPWLVDFLLKMMSFSLGIPGHLQVVMGFRKCQKICCGKSPLNHWNSHNVKSFGGWKATTPDSSRYRNKFFFVLPDATFSQDFSHDQDFKKTCFRVKSLPKPSFDTTGKGESHPIPTQGWAPEREIPCCKWKIGGFQ